MAKIKSKRFKCPSHWTVAERLSHYTAPPNENGCKLWIGGKNTDGYGWFKFRGKMTYAHRSAWMLANGDLPEDRPLILHRCDTPACCTVSHLFPGNDAINSSDREARGRGNQPKGEAQGLSKLTENQVRAIRKDKRSLSAIAADYGITTSPIHAIKRRKNWRHVK